MNSLFRYLVKLSARTLVFNIKWRCLNEPWFSRSYTNSSFQHLVTLFAQSLLLTILHKLWFSITCHNSWHCMNSSFPYLMTMFSWTVVFTILYKLWFSLSFGTARSFSEYLVTQSAQLCGFQNLMTLFARTQVFTILHKTCVWYFLALLELSCSISCDTVKSLFLNTLWHCLHKLWFQSYDTARTLVFTILRHCANSTFQYFMILPAQTLVFHNLP